MLFGSYAKNTLRSGSDVDLLIVLNVAVNSPHYQRRARQLSAGCFPPVDIVFATPEEISQANCLKSPFLASILERAITIYARPNSFEEQLNHVEPLKL